MSVTGKGKVPARGGGEEARLRLQETTATSVLLGIASLNSRLLLSAYQPHFYWTERRSRPWGPVDVIVIAIAIVRAVRPSLMAHQDGSSDTVNVADRKDRVIFMVHDVWNVGEQSALGTNLPALPSGDKLVRPIRMGKKRHEAGRWAGRIPSDDGRQMVVTTCTLASCALTTR
jgi:hypothetical protein